MELFLRPLEDPNNVTWSIVWTLIILLAGVTYYIYTIMKLAFGELEDARTNQSERRGPGSTDSTSDPQD
tara:strand:+ start:293 stop:499 length:207 start_codon:yes stop_codon:yes gene_type:complete